MSNKRNVSRREALKTMGVFAAGAALSTSGLTAASNLNLESDKRIYQQIFPSFTCLPTK